MENNSTEQEKIKKILAYSLDIDILKYNIKDSQETMNILKETVRNLMKEIGQKKIENEDVETKITYSFSFDEGYLMRNYPEIHKNYVRIEKIIVEKENIIIDKKNLKKDHPEIFNECQVENTPRLFIKRKR